MSAREKLGELVLALANAHFDCGAFPDANEDETQDYNVLMDKASQANKALMNFLEPYLPKD